MTIQALRMEIHDPIGMILREIEAGATQRCIAQTYALALRHSEAKDLEWSKANQAIIARWSLSGLERIKRLAWSGKAFFSPVDRGTR